jgi:hypothetical protein
VTNRGVPQGVPCFVNGGPHTPCPEYHTRAAAVRPAKRNQLIRTTKKKSTQILSSNFLQKIALCFTRGTLFCKRRTAHNLSRIPHAEQQRKNPPKFSLPIFFRKLLCVSLVLETDIAVSVKIDIVVSILSGFVEPFKRVFLVNRNSASYRSKQLKLSCFILEAAWLIVCFAQF